jgi:hypothetical protein
MLKRGSKGYNVGIVQIFLKSLKYYNGKNDNSYGPLTEQAVKNYQKAKKLIVDGVVGGQTVEQFFKDITVKLQKGSRGQLTDRYMGLLKGYGLYKGNMDSVFGLLMESAVKQYQSQYKLNVDGVIGNITGKHLLLNSIGVTISTSSSTSTSNVNISNTSSTSTNNSTTSNNYKIYYLDQNYGGDILKNPEIKDNIPMTSLFRQIADMSKNGRVIVELGEGNGPVSMIIACIHSNEEEASIATMRYLEEIKNQKIKGKLYVVPFALPQTMQINSRYYTYNGTSYDPNRTANYTGSPGYNLIQLAKKKNVSMIFDCHSGGGVSKSGLIFYKYDAETKLYNYIHLKSKCTGQKIGGIVGSLRKEANNKNIGCITLEVPRDEYKTSEMAKVEYNMLKPGLIFLGYP